MKPWLHFISALFLGIGIFLLPLQSLADTGSPPSTSSTSTNTPPTTTSSGTPSTGAKSTPTGVSATGTGSSSTPTTGSGPTAAAPQSTGAGTPSPDQTTTPSTVKIQTYMDPVKVDLSHLGEISVTPTGNYELINLDTNHPIAISGPIEMTVTPDDKGLLWIHEQDINQSSKKGYVIQELAGSTTPDFLSVFPASDPNANDAYRGTLTVTPNKIYNTLSMEDYLKGVIPREVYASWPMEALKAQTVACRNYAYNQMKTMGFVYDDQRSQVYGGMSSENARTNTAVEATKGLLMYYNGNPISAVFSSSNGGHTAQGSEVWGSNVPYLTAKPDPYDSYKNPNASWSQQISNETLSNKLGLTPESVVVNLAVSKATNYGRAQQVMATLLNTLTGKVSTLTLPNGSPDALRWAFGQSLLSTMFTIQAPNTSAQVMVADGTVQTVPYLAGGSIMQSDGTTLPLSDPVITVNDATTTYEQSLYPNSFTFNGSGDGHGLGLSQYGAYGMASQGKTYQQILDFYYTGVQIKAIPTQ